jgi:uncharacterized membrane protein YdbT with pleckstrin-like domain
MLTQLTITSLRPQEGVALYLRRHWFIIFKNIILFFILAILPLSFFLIFSASIAGWLETDLSAALIILSVSFYYLYLCLFLLFRWTDYYLDVWVVTNKRIVNREQNGLFNRVISEQELDRVQDVTGEEKGLLQTFLHFGNVYIQTAGTQERFLFEEVPHPFEVAKKIIQLTKEVKRQDQNTFITPPTPPKPSL